MFVASIAKALRGKKGRKPFRPVWQDTRPKDAALRTQQKIEAENYASFAAAFTATINSLINDDVLKRMRSALRDGDIEAAVEAPFQFDDDEALKRFGERLERAYGKVVQEGGQEAMREAGIRLGFTLETVRKAADEIVVPANPYSLAWIESEAAAMVTRINKSTREVLRQIIYDGYKDGLRVEQIAQQIQQRIGLTVPQAKAVRRLQQAMEKAGAPKTAIAEETQRKTSELLASRAEVIARTEIIRAANKGRQDAWVLAQEVGAIKETAIQRWLAVMASDRTCPICIGLDGETAAIGQPFISDLIGPVMSPTDTHPACRCVVTIEDHI